MKMTEQAFTNQDIKNFIVDQTLLKLGENVAREYEFSKRASVSAKRKKYSGGHKNYCQGAISYALEKTVVEMNATYLQDYIKNIDNPFSCQKFIASTQYYMPNSVTSGTVFPHKIGAESRVENTQISVEDLKMGDNFVYHPLNKARGNGRTATGDHTYFVCGISKDENGKQVGVALQGFNNDSQWFWGEKGTSFETIIPELKVENMPNIGLGKTANGRVAHLSTVFEGSLERAVEKEVKKNQEGYKSCEELEEEVLYAYLKDMGISKDAVKSVLVAYNKGEKTFISKGLDIKEKSDGLREKLLAKSVSQNTNFVNASKKEVEYASNNTTSKHNPDVFDDLRKRAEAQKRLNAKKGR